MKGDEFENWAAIWLVTQKQQKKKPLQVHDKKPKEKMMKEGMQRKDGKWEKEEEQQKQEEEEDKKTRTMKRNKEKLKSMQNEEEEWKEQGQQHQEEEKNMELFEFVHRAAAVIRIELEDEVEMRG